MKPIGTPKPQPTRPNEIDLIALIRDHEANQPPTPPKPKKDEKKKQT